MQSVIISRSSSIGTLAQNEIRLDFSSSTTFKNSVLTLNYIGIYYSWRNITSAFGNNIIKYKWTDGVTYTVTFPDGFYTITDLSSFLQTVMYKNNHYMLDASSNAVYFLEIQANSTYYAVTILSSVIAIPTGGSNPKNLTLGSVPQLIIVNNIGTTLGFVNGSYPLTSGTTVQYQVAGTLVPQISPITTVNVACSITNNNLNRYKSIISSFAPTSAYGSYLVIQPTNPIYYDIINGEASSISLRFVDQNYNPIAIIDNDITATLIIKPKE